MTRYAEWSQINMIIEDYERVYTVDIAIRYENRHNLNKAYQKNIIKYEDTAEFIKCATGTELENLKALGLSRSVALTVF